MKKTKKILSVLLAAAIMMTAGQTGLVTGLAAEAHVLTPIASGATVYKNDKQPWMRPIQRPVISW